MRVISAAAEERLRGLSKDKADLLRFLREEKSRKSQEIVRIAREPGEGLPTSLSQRRLWFIDQLERGSAAYNITQTLRLSGSLDQGALQQALHALIQRHEILRTVFVTVGGEPQQRILPEPNPAGTGWGRVLQIVDLSMFSAGERENQLRQHEDAEAQEKFDLGTGPLIRGRLLRVDAQEHMLLLTLHHIIGDGWSLEVLIRELAQLYQGVQLPALPVQYADYAHWQRQRLDAEALERPLQYWRTRLTGAPPQLELPTDRPRPPVQSYRGESLRVRIEAPLTAALKSLAQRREMTLFMVLYAGWAILLSRLSGQDDLVIGTPIANRPRPELEGLIGFFVDTLALRVGVSREQPLEQFLGQVKEVTLGAYDHQDVPFEKIVEVVQPERRLNRNPLFQVTLALQNTPKSERVLPGLTLTLEEGGRNTPAMFDLMLSLEEQGEELLGSLSYAADLFDRETIQRWLACFTVLLKGMTEGLQCRVGELPLMPERQRQQVVEQFNATQVSYPQEKLIHQLFEEQVARLPQAVAVVYEGQALTYAELDVRANQLAYCLRGQGVVADQLVGLCVERSLEMVVGMVGILKAGGAYLPLDPSYPPERLRYILRDAAPPLLLTQERLRGKLPDSDARVIALDGDWEEIARRHAADGNDPASSHAALAQMVAGSVNAAGVTATGINTPGVDTAGINAAEVNAAGINAPGNNAAESNAAEVAAHHLAYVIYTSGSTGNPKGVMVEHRQLHNLVRWHIRTFDLGAGSRTSHTAGLGFDASVWEAWVSLCCGSTLLLAPGSGAADPEKLLLWWQEQSLDVSFLITPLAELAYSLGKVNRGVRTLLIGGDRLRRWPESLLQGQKLVNNYGPTETTVVATSGELHREDRVLHIGRPIDNTQIYVLDELLRPVPIGVAGELYIGGAGVARGYLNQPELTAERFVESAAFGKRLYKTGDLGRWRADGTVEYLGRNDGQVKVRGFRIELGEIEAHLVRHPQVKEAVVLAREETSGEKRLVTYVIAQPAQGSKPDADALRAHLKSTLPEYMVPSAFVLLERFPLTPNGKLDRRALPAPEQSAYLSREFEAPEGEVEEILAGIWQGLLHVERVGRRDNFFELGGHSLLIVQMLERLRRVGLSAELRRVFESPTLADLAKALLHGTAQAYDVPPNLIPEGCDRITPEMLPLVQLDQEHIERIAASVPGGAANIQDVYPLTALQEGILFHHLLERQRDNETARDVYARSLRFSFATRGKLDQFVQALQAVIDRHDILRTAVVWEGLPQPLQVVLRNVPLPVYELQSEHHADAAEKLEQRLKSQPLDLRRAPLMALDMTTDLQGTCYAALQTHHLVCDNESLDVLVSEVMAHLEGRAQELPPTLPYRNHVAQVIAQARTEDAEGFFTDKLRGIDEPTAPFGLLDVHTDGRQIVYARRDLDASLARTLRHQASRLGVSAATLFHAAWALVVSQTSGRDDVVYGTVLLGRLHGSAGAQRILGMFINTLPLRLRLEGISAEELVEETQRGLVDLLGHEQASLAVAQRCSGISGSAPLFTALMNYRHNPADGGEQWFEGTGVNLLSSEGGTHYPIVLSVNDLEEGFGLEMEVDQRLDAERLLGYVAAALDSLSQALESAPQTAALTLSVLPEGERQRLLEHFNDSQVVYPEKLVHQLIEEQVERTPTAQAVVYEGQSLTYAELNARANQLAHCLRGHGVVADQLVGLCVERSIEMVVGLLGILKAGGAYVPLDPSYPPERLSYMLQDAAPRLLLTQAHLRGKLPPSAARVITLDEGWDEIAQHRAETLDSGGIGVSARSLAYVIYTSGSTGKPKGAMNEHRGVANRLQWMQDAYQLDEHDRVLQKTPFSFDVSVWEFFWPLMTGARLVVAPPEVHKDPVYLAELIERTGITTLHFVPSMLQSFLDQHRPGQCPSLRHIVCSGEELPSTLQMKCFEHLPQAQLSNLYGPTEAAVDVTAWECSPNDRGARVPIGRPISNIQMYVLDRRGQPAPIGVSGEIFIGGVGVGRGYWNRPELTAERFVDDPFHGPSDNRLYKTGDLGRWRADGTLEYLGRNDSQVKVRGFRIELGEIEAQLLRHELVKEAVVLAREETAGEKRLVAYVVAQSAQGSPPGVEALRNHLKSTLPEHMVPSAFVLLDRFPLSPNGKLDRRALPAPGQGAYLSREYAAPEGEVEEILAGIWQSLLRVERVGRRDNFFELGGHSLLIVQMLERLRRVGLSAELRRVFESATLADLANELLRGGAAQTYEVPPNRIPEGCERITPEMLPLVQLEQEHIERIVSCVPGGATNIQDIYPLTALQEGILFHHMLDQHGSSADIYARSVVFSVSSQEVLEKFILALQGVIDRHDILRTAVVWEHLPQPLQVVLRRASLSVRETAVERLDLRRAPLMRLEVTADPKQRGSYYATLQTHHLVIDNESIDILVAEVMAYLEGRAGELPEAQPYRNHVAQVISQARAHDVEVFFRDKLHDVDESSAAFGLVDVHAEGRQIAHAHHELDSALAHTLRLQARHLGVSAATLFHAAWALVISQTTGREDVVYGTVLSGRLHGSAGAQRILGMFINTLPLRLRLEGTSVKQLVERTQRELVDLLGYEQASLAVAQRCSGISGSAPLFNALINYRHNPADQATQWFEGTGVNLLTSGGGTNYPIVLSVNDLEEGFGLDVEVDQRLDPQRLLGYVATALQSLSLALDGDGKVAALALSVLPSSERRLLIERFNGTEEEGHSRQKLIHQLFEEQVERTPLAQAVVYEGRSLTFAELNARANQLAHYLRERGVVADQLVGLCVERSLDLVVGLLGILKAGGAYLPLDPTHPPERLSYMLQDAAPRLLLTQGHLRGKLPLIEDQILSLDEEWEAAIAPRPVSNPQASGVTADGLAYVIYTSGSTGQPKGVLIEHRNVVNHWQALESLYRQPYDCRRIALNAPVTFDASVQQWVQLLSGCTLVIVPAAARLDAQLFQDFLGQYQIEGIDCTPSQLSTWVSAGLLDKGDSPLRTVLVGGEPIDAALWTRLERSAVSSYNVYGPTECTVDSTAAVLQGQSSDPHIGRPLRNTRVYLLDARRNPVPMGVPGELYIGGAGVARGYLKRVELTAQRFVEDPFSPHPQARMYQTGDLGRWREDGTIEYLGRNDTQVKLRGYRIELGEIEAQLTRLDEVKEAVVVVREDVPGDKRLVAYVVPTASAPASAEALREELSRSLPDYMVPSAFVTLKSLPLTPNGKLDRRALPAPELGAYTSRQYEPPRGEVEELLATIWQELLRVERVGRGDNFFELGGHSLLATRVMTRIRHDIDVDLPLRVLFAAPTIEALGRRILTEIATDMSLEAS